MNTLQVTTINTRGLNDVVKCQSVFNLLHEAGSDIFFTSGVCNILHGQLCKV